MVAASISMPCRGGARAASKDKFRDAAVLVPPPGTSERARPSTGETSNFQSTWKVFMAFFGLMLLFGLPGLNNGLLYGIVAWYYRLLCLNAELLFYKLSLSPFPKLPLIVGALSSESSKAH